MKYKVTVTRADGEVKSIIAPSKADAATVCVRVVMQHHFAGFKVPYLTKVDHQAAELHLTLTRGKEVIKIDCIPAPEGE